VYTIPVRNVHAAYPEALNVLLEFCIQQPSRNGPVYVSPWPVATVYERPDERVVFYEERDANPYFHFMEALGFLGGISDVEFYARYAKQIANYSDDGRTLPASYGHRWRHYFDRDQLAWAVRRLRDNPHDRRVVISMWDPARDPIVADANGKDVPCNTHCYVNIFGGYLNMQVCNRSNDIFWGAYGANAVHMGFLHEYLARHVGVQLGWMIQHSFNWHAYADVYNKIMNEREASSKERSLRNDMAIPHTRRWQPYTDLNTGGLPVFPIVNGTDRAEWDHQLGIFLKGGVAEGDGLTDPFFTEVAVPIRESHAAYRNKQYTAAAELARSCAATDWRRGCLEWLDRRAGEREAKAAATKNRPTA
jgi:thymidylate synthase